MTMTTQASSSTISRSDLKDSLDIFEVKPGYKFGVHTLHNILPDVETALFFGKVYELDYAQLAALMQLLFKSDLLTELMSGAHSTDLQDYIVDIVPPVAKGSITFKPNVPHGEILPELWKAAEVQIAQSIKDVAVKLKDTFDVMPGKQGQMVFKQLATVNAKRPTIGDYRAAIAHPPVQDNLVILDVSGSMTEHTIRKIIDDVVALSYMANAHLAVVSNTTTHWEPGTYGVDDVLARCEFGGTHYETLAELLGANDWGVVVTIADYDSSASAQSHLKKTVTTRIGKVLDISLVNRPTFLAECVGQFATEVEPLLIAQTHYVLNN